MKPEYHEGEEALDKFNKTLTTLFRAPKTVTTKKAAKKSAKRNKTSKG
jgi:hypothetical protein